MQDLEEQIAHLTRIVDDLNDVVIRQQTEIDGLSRKVALLMARETDRAAQQEGGVFIGDERPPHY